MASSLEDDLRELLKCAVCLGTLSEPKFLPCSHRFCKTCILMKIEKSATTNKSLLYFPCPICKREIFLSKDRDGEACFNNVEPDSLLKDIQDRLDEETEDLREICLSHRKKLSVVCYSCGTTGCYTCAWQDHRHCTDVKNFQSEAKKTKIDLQKYLEECMKCIEIIIPYVQNILSARESFFAQRENSRAIEKRFQDIRRKSVFAVKDLLKKYDRYLQRSNASKRIEREIRLLMGTFPDKITGQINLLDLHAVQSQNEASIRNIWKELGRVPDLLILMHTMENITEILDLCTEDIVLKGRAVLTGRTVEIIQQCSDFAKQIKESSISDVDPLTTRAEDIDLGNGKPDRLLENLHSALRNSKTPKKLMETTGWLCYPNGYKPEFEIVEVLNSTATSVLTGRRTALQRTRMTNCMRGRTLCHSYNIPNFVFHSFNCLRNRANGEPFPKEIGFTKVVIPNFKQQGPYPVILHGFANKDDEEEGRESERITLEDIGDNFVLQTNFKLSYAKEFPVFNFEKLDAIWKVIIIIVILGICMMIVFISLVNNPN